MRVTKIAIVLEMDELARCDIRLPDLREEIAQCERLAKMHDACMVQYVDPIPG
jgi:hypothetical protein